jgi:hypothetical protein
MGGSVSSVTAYPELTDKPSINGVEINGAMTSSMLHLAGELPEIMPISKGGTGNNAGYIRTGQKPNTTIGNKATAEGSNVTASGYTSHGEGSSTEATGNYSHSEGDGTTASGYASHSEGQSTTASGRCSHAGGRGTIAANDCQTVIGKYNNNQTDTLFEIGNGIGRNNESNAFEVYSNGDINLTGQINVKGTPLFRSRGFTINAVPSDGSVSIGGHSTYYFTAMTSRATWDDNFSEYKPFSIICAQAGSPTTKNAELVVTIDYIQKDTNTGRIRD